MKFLGIGNPLLDLTVYTDKDTLHQKYNIKLDDAILAGDEHMPIFDEITQQKDLCYSAGGATLNTLRMIQWLLYDKPRSVCYFGCIGQDEEGLKLKQCCESLGLETIFQEDAKSKTGKCAVIVKGHDRSMVTYLGAAINYTHARMCESMWTKAKEADVYYSAGYFVTSCIDSLLKVAEIFSQDKEKLFTFNISAPFLPAFYTEQIHKILPYVDILFGNHEEAKALAKSYGLDETNESIANFFMNLPRPEKSQTKERIILITNGAKDIYYQTSSGLSAHIAIPKVDETIVDSNGAGDGFVAGFLCKYAKCKSIEKSINSGIKTAQYILLQSGFTLGDRKDFIFDL